MKVLVALAAVLMLTGLAQPLGSAKDGHEAAAPPHGVVMLKVEPEV